MFFKGHIDHSSRSPLAPGGLTLGRGLSHVSSEGTDTVVFTAPCPSPGPDTQKALHPHLWVNEQTVTSTAR